MKFFKIFFYLISVVPVFDNYSNFVSINHINISATRPTFVKNVPVPCRNTISRSNERRNVGKFFLKPCIICEKEHFDARACVCVCVYVFLFTLILSRRARYVVGHIACTRNRFRPCPWYHSFTSDDKVKPTHSRLPTYVTATYKFVE